MTPDELNQYSQYIDRDRLNYIDRQGQLFEAAKPSLLQQYANEYVAFEDGQVLDHDLNRQQLARRMYQKFGYRDLYMRKVIVEEPTYSIGGFQMDRKTGA